MDVLPDLTRQGKFEGLVEELALRGFRSHGVTPLLDGYAEILKHSNPPRYTVQEHLARPAHLDVRSRQRGMHRVDEVSWVEPDMDDLHLN